MFSGEGCKDVLQQQAGSVPFPASAKDKLKDPPLKRFGGPFRAALIAIRAIGFGSQESLLGTPVCIEALRACKVAAKRRHSADARRSLQNSRSVCET